MNEDFQPLDFWSGLERVLSDLTWYKASYVVDNVINTRL